MYGKHCIFLKKVKCPKICQCVGQRPGAQRGCVLEIHAPATVSEAVKNILFRMSPLFDVFAL